MCRISVHHDVGLYILVVATVLTLSIARIGDTLTGGIKISGEVTSRRDECTHPGLLNVSGCPVRDDSAYMRSLEVLQQRSI